MDALGERLTLGLGLGMVALSSLACGFATTYWQLLVFRCAGGLGSSMFSVSASALLMRTVSDSQRAKAQSIYNSGFLVGGIIGPAFGGLLLAISVRSPFFVYAVTLTCASLTAFFFLHEKRLGRSTKNEQVPADRVTIKEALSMRPYRIALVVVFLSNWVLFGIRQSILPLFVTQELHVSNAGLGFGFTFSAIAQGAMLVYAGRLTDSKGRRWAILVGGALLMSGLMIFIFATVGTSYFLAMIIFGLGGAFMGTAPISIVGDLFGGRGGQVIAIFQMAGDAGIIVAPLVIGYLVDVYSYKVAFIVSAALFLISIFMAWRLPAKE